MNPHAGFYHVAQTPDGIVVFHIDPLVWEAEARRRMRADPELAYVDAVAEVAADICEAQRRQLGFPAKGRWQQRDGWDSMWRTGPLHPSVLAAALEVRDETIL
jgi:hypothetical protein